MILSGRDIEWYIERGKLKIDPVSPEQFQQNGIDLILNDVTRVHYTTFWLGGTRETLVLPDDLMAFVQLRSTWARKGLMIPPTMVDAGFCGNLTVEILEVACSPLEAVGKPFLHVAFAKMSSPGIPYAGKYQGQSGITGPR